MNFIFSKKKVTVLKLIRKQRMESNYLAVTEPIELSRENLDKIALIANPAKRICPNPSDIV